MGQGCAGFASGSQPPALRLKRAGAETLVGSPGLQVLPEPRGYFLRGQGVTSPTPTHRSLHRLSLKQGLLLLCRNRVLPPAY